MMKLTLAEKMLLIALRTDVPRYQIGEIQLNGGLAIAILLDLHSHEHISIRDEKVKVLNPSTSLTTIHQDSLDRIANHSKEKNLAFWVNKLAYRIVRYRHQFLENMQTDGLVKVENKKWLFIKYKQAYLLKENEQRQLLQGVKQAVNQRYPDDESVLPLLMLMKICGMYKLLAEEKSQIKEVKRTLKDRFLDHSMYKGLDKGYKSLVAAASAAV